MDKAYFPDSIKKADRTTLEAIVQIKKGMLLNTP